ncbi:MAG: hypothetical protein HZC38_03410 [Chloroflexi bacterium]|nr:hypothetical protein [Chloroflexota bacterium]
MLSTLEESKRRYRQTQTRGDLLHDSNAHRRCFYSLGAPALLSTVIQPVQTCS